MKRHERTVCMCFDARWIFLRNSVLCREAVRQPWVEGRTRSEWLIKQGTRSIVRTYTRSEVHA